MGQRSQIYIRYKNTKGVQLIARYFSWNYGERMVSRARGIIEWLVAYKEHYSWLFDNKNKTDTLVRICETNFDMRDVHISSDIAKEIREQFAEEAERDGLNMWIFGQHNNDGQLLIDVCDDKIKYAFIPYFTDKDMVMGATAYMEWNRGKDWQTKLRKPIEDGETSPREYTVANIQYISNHAKLMTQKEVDEFLTCDYSGAVFGYPF